MAKKLRRITTVGRNKQPRKVRVKQRPICPVHGVLMNCKSTVGDIRYYYCPYDTCKESQKQVNGTVDYDPADEED
tara:strand:+ start:3644 stop:3868 length:225 start_codon:yes stop_codon:yes gene_type:complete